MDGTHKPTNTPSSFIPVNHSDTEKTKDTPAAKMNPNLASRCFFTFYSFHQRCDVLDAKTVSRVIVKI